MVRRRLSFLDPRNVSGGSHHDVVGEPRPALSSSAGARVKEKRAATRAQERTSLSRAPRGESGSVLRPRQFSPPSSRLHLSAEQPGVRSPVVCRRTIRRRAGCRSLAAYRRRLPWTAISVWDDIRARAQAQSRRRRRRGVDCPACQWRNHKAAASYRPYAGRTSTSSRASCGRPREGLGNALRARDRAPSNPHRGADRAIPRDAGTT